MLNVLSLKQYLTALPLVLLTLIALVITPQAASAQVVLPNRLVDGYSLNDLASDLALFDTSGNDTSYLPDTPFQVVYLDPSTVIVTNEPKDGMLITGGNSFTVAPGTAFFVPIYYTDDSPPIIGNWPTDASSAITYFFGVKQLGFKEGSVTVDNKRPTGIGKDFLAGPVQVPSLLDGDGTHLIQLGFFMRALSPGQHTLVVQGRLTGSAFRAATGLSYQAFIGTYSVTVTGD